MRKVRPTLVVSPSTPEQSGETSSDFNTEPAQEKTEIEFRPRLRPPITLLTVVDDGRDSGEVIRIRSDSTTVGRRDCDINIPHDSLMSGSHLEITRAREGNGYRWHLKDLQSTNGSFFRIKRFRMKSGFEILAGAYRYRLQLPAESESDESEDVGTRGWTAVTPETLANLTPQLIQIDGEEEVSRFRIENSAVLGTGAVDIRVDDPQLSDSHVRIFQDTRGIWRAEDQNSRNGTWVRGVHSVATKACQFQLGEQRFSMKVL